MVDKQTQNLDQKQIDELKENIIKQINKNPDFSQEQKDQFIKKINSLDNEGFIQFLKKQGIIKDQDSGQQEQENSSQSDTQQCIFCSIVFGDTPSWKIGENEKAIAVLELNPLSKGHSLVIPKEHISDKNQIPEEAKQLAMNISKKIKSELGPKEVKFEGKTMFGHQTLNIIPLYEGQDPGQLQQKQASQDELKELHSKLQLEKTEEKKENKEPEKESPDKEEKKEEINEENFWLPRRIP